MQKVPQNAAIQFGPERERNRHADDENQPPDPKVRRLIAHLYEF